MLLLNCLTQSTLNTAAEGTNSVNATNAYVATVRRYIAKEQEAAEKAGTTPEAISAKARKAAFEEALNNKVHELAQPPPQPETTTESESNVEDIILMSLVALLGVFMIRFAVQAINAGTRLPAAKAEDSLEKLLAEEPSVVEFFNALREGPVANVQNTGGASASATPIKIGATGFHAPLIASDKVLAELLVELGNLLFKVEHAETNELKLKSLQNLREPLRKICESCTAPESLASWQLALALEGLLEQLARRGAEATPSVLRTIDEAVRLLDKLCSQPTRTKAGSTSAVRILAVDDDAISRKAISFALKQAFNEPELAQNGQEALKKAEAKAFDLMFLDVDMPGMDGFELCLKLREGKLNVKTPTIFVTRMDDFASRVKANQSGGEDLIAKPFLSFEITVKALTLVLRSKLREQPAAAPKVIEKDPVPRKSEAAVPALDANDANKVDPSTKLPEEEKLSAVDETVEPSTEPEIQEAMRQFFKESTKHVGQLRTQLEQLRGGDAQPMKKALLGQCYMGTKLLSSAAQRAELAWACKLTCALESLIRKLMENGDLCSPETLKAAESALELINELCAAEYHGEQLNRAGRILVVDDDPIGQRALGASLQLLFGRPDLAGSGEVALAAANTTVYDLIFLDVIMPGMDGFQTCARIHEASLNKTTPVVFVTGRNDMASRMQAGFSGARGYVTKPFLASQITLIALTYTLRADFEKRKGQPAKVKEPEAAKVPQAPALAEKASVKEPVVS
jgi:CheY-like chemotaxis protein